MIKILVAVAIAAACSACSYASPEPETTPATKTTTAAPAAPPPTTAAPTTAAPVNPFAQAFPTEGMAPCADVFRPGQVIDKDKAKACLNPDGGIEVVGSFRCADGRYLYQADARTGAPKGWGFSGDVYHAAPDLATDPGYGAAYRACNQ